MNRKDELIYRTAKIFMLIILYYIVRNRSIFLYVLSLSVFNIFRASLSHIDITSSLYDLRSAHDKKKLMIIVSLSLLLITLLFSLLSVCLSDICTIFLGIDDTLLIFIIMSISVISLPLVKIYSEYLENITNRRFSKKIVFFYHMGEEVLLLIIALLFFRIFKIKVTIAIALLYLAKVISALIILAILYLIDKNITIRGNNQAYEIDYKKEIKKIYLTRSMPSFITVVKNSYYYLSIVILYYILTTRYAYANEIIDESITFIYLYALEFINYLIYLALIVNDKLSKKMNSLTRIYQNLKLILPVSIILSVISPLISLIFFGNSVYSGYLVMVIILAGFILLFELTFREIKQHKIIILSLLIGIIVKIVLVIPLINAIYQMGYNAVMGDILSTILGMFLSIIINYIYIRKRDRSTEKYFDKILDILYANIILAIILILLEFIIPTNTNNYFKAMGLIMLYLLVSLCFIKIKMKKRG